MSASKPTQLTPFGYALAGALGGCFSNASVVKTRIQAATEGNEKEKLSIKSLLLRILKEEGIAGYYRGFIATMLNTFSMQYAYFFFYSFVRTSGLKGPPLSTAAELILGAIAGALAQIFTIPVAVIATRQQVGRSLDRQRRSRAASLAAPDGPSYAAVTDPAKDVSADVEKAAEKAEQADYDDSFFGVAKEIVDEEGVTGLWLGIKPGLVLTVNPAITYGVYERVKSVLLLAQERAKGGLKLSPWTSFVVGALSKTLATVVTYPYIMAKVRIQARSADSEEAVEEHQPTPPKHAYHHAHSKHVGALDILARVYRHQGILGWYQGMGAQITKAVLSQALLFMSKDQFEHWALAIMVIWWKIRHAKA
ncbi:mitochondrial carrier domain-containing protein [Fomitopsis serialis]|uniref:mitochondrial carrier domain-containing protein n=1 Tax=Fomitopsis serialis TaxID=139415 RepID=UPI0020073B04|nr:mitochondrial carrier domain-containing protein [Neoantrodia serialis]KAH9928375.1 mitochondrial carrier domain-containing protein [Neoantrodia serialis]